jgi:MFS family permease
VLTVFIAVATALISLIVLLAAFLGGELSTRFGLKATFVLLVSSALALHFIADLRGYWLEHSARVRAVAVSAVVLAAASVVAGFLVLGSPAEMRDLRLDAQRVSDLQTIQYQVVDEYQRTGTIPADLASLADSFSGFIVPVDPEAGGAYEYARTGALSFELCAEFAGASPVRGHTTAGGMASSFHRESWDHEAGRTCFARMIDPERYPVLEPERR